MLNAFRALCLSMALLPVLAGPSVELAVPVYYARVELEERAPVALQLALPAADYLVSPSSLGYFASDGEFVYSAEVARGLIYGRRNGEVLVVEIAAPESAELYLDRQLEVIRGYVNLVNDDKNMLRLGREENPLKSSAAMRLMAVMRQQLGPDLGGELPESWQDLLPAGEELNYGLLESALANYASHRVKLKQLFYECQASRLQLILSEYDLQLGLSRLPQPEIAGLISLGNESLVQATMMEKIDRLAKAWQARRSQLIRQTASDRRLLERTGTSRESSLPSPPETVLEPYNQAGSAALTEQESVPAAESDNYSWFPSFEDSQQNLTDGKKSSSPLVSWQAAQALLEARLLIANAELEQLEERLDALAEASEHVQVRGLPSWTDLPHHSPQPERLRLNGLEALQAFAHVEAQARTPQTTIPLLLALAQEFERPGTTELIADWQLNPDEVAYGLLAVDRCRLGPTEEQAAEGGDPLEALMNGLGEIISFPAEYNTASYNLGFLEFILWYAGLERQPAAPLEAVDKPAAGPVENSANEAADSKIDQQADVDSLFN